MGNKNKKMGNKNKCRRNKIVFEIFSKLKVTTSKLVINLYH